MTFVHTSLRIHSLGVLMGKWHGIPNQTSIHRQIQVGSWLYCEPWQNSNFTNVSADHGSPASHHRDQAGNILIIAIEVGKAVSCKDFLSDLQWKFSVKSIEIDVLSICLITCVFTVGWGNWHMNYYCDWVTLFVDTWNSFFNLDPWKNRLNFRLRLCIVRLWKQRKCVVIYLHTFSIEM